MNLETESIKGPNGHYWIVTAFQRGEAASYFSWAILSPSGSVFVRGDDERYGETCNESKIRDREVLRCRKKLQRYFAKWTDHHGIPVPP